MQTQKVIPNARAYVVVVVVVTVADATGVAAEAPLSDAPEDVAAQLRELAARNQIMAGDVIPTGRWYAGFVQEINRLKEERDAGLVDLKVGSHSYLSGFEYEKIKKATVNGPLLL